MQSISMYTRSDSGLAPVLSLLSSSSSVVTSYLTAAIGLVYILRITISVVAIG